MNTHMPTRILNCQEPGRETCHAIAASIPNPTLNLIGVQRQETADAYHGVVAHLCAHHRVITCRDDIQWVFQRRKKGDAERPWRGVGYFRTREALIRACASLCGRIDPCALAILAALPEHIGGS